MKNTKTDNNEPILDAKLMEQLRMELYGTGLVDDNENDTNSSIFSRTKISSSTNVNGSMLVIGASVIGLLGMQFPFLFIKHAPFMATPSRKIQDAIKFLNHQKAAAVASTRTTPMASLSRTATPTSVAVAQRSSPSLPPPKPPIFVDLGSGDGQAVYEAAKLGHNAVGIEFNWTLWALSSLRRLFFWPSHVKRRSRFLLQDFSNYDLKDANTVMIFAVPRTMPILGQKIQSECSPGTNIMAYRFEMPLATTSTGSSSSNVVVTPKQKNSTTENGNGGGDKSQEGSDRISDRNEEAEDDDEDLRLRASCIYDREEMRIYRMGE